MKAIVFHDYGSPDVLRCEEIEKPAAADGQVLIKVRAASVNPRDRHFMRGTPYPIRMATGFGKPHSARLGVDVAGEVEAVGANVTRFKPGDEVYGTCEGTLAEYACAPQKTLELKPANLTFEQAAAVPLAAMTALQALRRAKVQAGQHVLINGASGGVGTFAVQLAKLFGARVTAVCSTCNVEMARTLGADDVIDYTQADLAKDARRYDVILDCVGNHTLATCRRLLKPKGTYLIVGGHGGPWIGPLARALRAVVLSRLVRENMVMVLARSSKEDLATLHDLIRDGKITPVIDKCYPLTEAPAAMRHLETGHARGKVVIAL